MPLTAAPAEHPRPHAPPAWAASKIAATPRSRAWSAHSRSVSATRSVSCVATRDQRLGGLAEEHRRRRRPHHARAVRLLEGLQQRQPVGGRRRGEDVGVAGVDGRDSDRRQGVAADPGVAVRLDDDRDVARGHRPAVVRRPATRAAPRCRRRGRLPHGHGGGPSGPFWCPASRTCRGSPRAAGTGRCGARRRGGGRCGGPRPSRTTISSCPRAAPSSTTWSRSTRGRSLRQLVPRVQCWSAALGGPQVGDDVAAAEGVDRLLGVADQDHGGVADEGALDHLPLHRVGVLELVDHARSASAAASGPGRGSPRPRGRSRAGSAGRRSPGCPAAACAAPARRARPGRSRPGRPAGSRSAGRPACSVGRAGWRPPHGPATAPARG